MVGSWAKLGAMRDTDLYRQVLGLQSPWTVSRVELGVKEGRVDIWAEHTESSWECPACKRKLAIYDHSEERSWRHLDTCQFKTYLHARIPRVQCEEHGVRQIEVPWAEARSRFTALFERLAIDVLKVTDVKSAGGILGISWDEARHVMERAVRRGLLRKEKRVVPHIGVDEKSIKKRHNYMTLVCDIDRATVEYVAEDRKVSSLDGYFEQLSAEQLNGIQSISMDMHDAYFISANHHVPDAARKIVFDRFHIFAYMGKAVDQVRRREHKELRVDGTSELTGSRFLWLYGKENVPEQDQLRFRELKALNLKTGRAWAIKESLRELWSYRSETWARRFFKEWYRWATHSRLRPVIEVARMLKRRLENVMTYFRHRVTNAVLEGLNSKIQTVKKRAYGFRNKESFKTAILFHCGGLDLYPRRFTHGEA